MRRSASAHGYTVLTSYTWSKKMDDYNWTNPYNRRFDYGLSREDVPHNFKFSNVWNIPAPQREGIAGKLDSGLDAEQHCHLAERVSVLDRERP